MSQSARRLMRAECNHPDRRMVHRRVPGEPGYVDYRCPDCDLRWSKRLVDDSNRASMKEE